MSRFAAPSRSLAVLALVLGGWALLMAWAPRPAAAQIYDPTTDVEKTWKTATIGTSDITRQHIEEFLADLPPWATVKKFRNRLSQLDSADSALLVAKDPELRNSMSAARIWTGAAGLAAHELHSLTEEFPKQPLYWRNYAAALEKGPKLYKQALEAAEKAVALEGGKKISPLEQWRLQRLDYLQRCATDVEWSKHNHFLPYMTAAFNSRGLPPTSFRDLRLPESATGLKRLLMEMLTYHPEFADGYLCLGILVESSHDYIGAYNLYKKAIEWDHPRSIEIKTHINSMSKLLPKGYTLAGSGGTMLINIIRGLVGAALMIAFFKALPYLWVKMGGGSGQKKKRWSPDKWKEFEEDRLHEELEMRLNHDPAMDFARNGKSPAAKPGLKVKG
jgi:tetratricopeptide (TPR) repeat protein